MIEIPPRKWAELIDWFDVDISQEADYGESKIKNALSGRPFIAEFEPIRYRICALKREIHDEMGSYLLLNGNRFGEYGIERAIYVAFDNKDDELIFKLSHL